MKNLNNFQDNGLTIYQFVGGTILQFVVLSLDYKFKLIKN